jgi:hypothetical protein
MRTVRALTGALGIALIGFGGLLVLTGGRATDPLSVLTFVAVPLVVHDGLLAPAVVVAGWLCARYLPAAARAPFQVALLVGGSLALVALPLLAVDVLGRRSADNPSALPLDYAANLTGLLAAVLAIAVVSTAVRFARRRRSAGSVPAQRS